MWIQENNSDARVLHRAVSAENTQDSIKCIVLECATYAFSLFDENVKNESMYCLFDWDYAQQTLTIDVTDPSKQILAKHTVQLILENYDAYLTGKEDQLEQMQLWLHNFLTTSAEFLQYSLVAAMVADGDISQSVLL